MKLFLLLITFSLNAYSSFSLKVIHTNDLHSHFIGSGLDRYAESTKEGQVLGHYARITTAIKEEKYKSKVKDEAVILVDAGDFFSRYSFSRISTK